MAHCAHTIGVRDAAGDGGIDKTRDPRNQARDLAEVHTVTAIDREPRFVDGAVAPGRPPVAKGALS